MACVIGVTNQKGGVGKTTVSTNVATRLAQAGYDVLLIDADPQASSIDWASNRNEADELPLTVVGIPTPATLRSSVRKLRDKHDFIIIDGVPRTDLMTKSILKISDFVIVPVLPSPYDVWACQDIVNLIEHAQIDNDELKAYFVINRKIPNTKINDDVVDALNTFDALDVFKTQLNQYIVYSDAATNGRGVCETTHKNARSQIVALVDEILEHVNND